MNKKMRVFPKGMLDYEKVYTNERYLAHFDINRLQKPYGFDSVKDYKNALRNFLLKKSVQLWCDIAETEWMLSNFRYVGKRNYYVSTHVNAALALNIFTKEFVGVGFSFMSSSFYYNKVKSYFKELFPRFYKDNPFQNPKAYAYPFKNLSLDYLILVYQMPERLDLLKYAEERNMPFGQFIDFVINYIGKYNDMEKKDVFHLIRSDHYPVYVKYLLKKK